MCPPQVKGGIVVVVVISVAIHVICNIVQISSLTGIITLSLNFVCSEMKRKSLYTYEICSELCSHT